MYYFFYRTPIKFYKYSATFLEGDSAFLGGHGCGRVGEVRCGIIVVGW